MFSVFLYGILIIVTNITVNIEKNGPTVKDPNLVVEQIVSDLELPTKMAFIGEDDFLVLEKNGQVQSHEW